jgi:acetyltransferase
VTLGGETLGGETAAVLRPVLPSDRRHLVRGLARMSSESRYLRFLTPMPRFSAWQIRYLTEVDQRDHVAWTVFARESAGWAGVAVGRWVRLADEPDAAEFALTVVDDWQGRGLGRLLLGTLAAAALPRGVRRLRAELLAGNRRMLALLRAHGAATRLVGGGVLVAELPVAGLAPRLLDAELLRAVRCAVRAARGVRPAVGIERDSAQQS